MIFPVVSLLLAQTTPPAPADPNATTASVATPASAESSRTLIDYVHDGGILSYLLVIVSIVAVTLIVRNILLLRRSKIMPPEDVHRLDVLLREGNIRGALAYCENPQNESSLTRIIGGALRRCARSSFGMLELRSALEESGGREVERLYRLTDGIGMIAAVGPMMGLLGTVIGMIGAFATLGTLEGAARSQGLSNWMSVALVCTAEGLIIAIPCTLIFSIMRRHIDKVIGEAGETIEELAGHIQNAGGDREPSPSSAAPTRASRPAAPRAATAERGA